MPTNITKTYSMFAVVLVLGLIFGGYYVMTNLWPNYKQSQAAYARIQNENTNLQQALESVSTFLDNYKSQQANAAKANLALPKQQVDMANFLSSLQELAQQSSTALSNLQIGEENTSLQANSIQVQDIDFAASGSYQALKDFILKLETHLRLVDIYQLTLSTSTDDNTTGTPILEYQIKLKTYYQQ